MTHTPTHIPTHTLHRDMHSFNQLKATVMFISSEVVNGCAEGRKIKLQERVYGNNSWLRHYWLYTMIIIISLQKCCVLPD